MLGHHRFSQERSADAARRQAQSRYAYGKWLKDLNDWDWFLTITFRNGSLRDDLRGVPVDMANAEWPPAKRA